MVDDRANHAQLYDQLPHPQYPLRTLRGRGLSAKLTGLRDSHEKDPFHNALSLGDR